MGNKHIIYKNPDIEKKLIDIYDDKMTQWPVPYENCYTKTRYGQVHIIINGPENAPPIILLHALAISSWSRIYNIKMLIKYYRTYAIDTISDAGRSVLTDIEVFPNNVKELAELYKEIMDTLNIQKVHFIGASQG